MSKLDRLPEITDRALHGLKADDALKARIYQQAAGGEKQRGCGTSFRFLPAAMASVAVMLLCVFLLNGKEAVLPQQDSSLIHSFSAGDGGDSLPSFEALLEDDAYAVRSIELRSVGAVSEPDQISRLLDALRESGVEVDEEIRMEDRITLELPGDESLQLDAQNPFIRWSDETIQCARFFELFAEFAK